MAEILIIDDDQIICTALSRFINRMGHSSEYALTLKDGLEKSAKGTYDAIYLDVSMPDGSGLAALPELKESISRPEIIIFTGYGDPDGAELAIRSGAWDYVEKSSSISLMIQPLVRALKYREEKTQRHPSTTLSPEGIIGKSPKMKNCFALLAQAVESDASILITGETGTGKELFAKAIHENSSRAEKNFVVVDCAALPETIVESVLFGHERGAFTGADKAQEGLIKQADGGTLFLDEIGELPLSIQKNFLRVLQEHKFRPVGKKKEKNSNFRLVAATNRDLDQMTKKGLFRKDLLFRIRSLTIELPNLKDRKEDIPNLIKYHLDKLCSHYRMDKKDISPEFIEALELHDWPGNVRELINILESALALGGHEATLYSKHLPTHIRVQMARFLVEKHKKETSVSEVNPDPDEGLPKLKDFRNAMEKQYLLNLVHLSKKDIKKACHISGLSRSRLYELFQKQHISINEN